MSRWGKPESGRYVPSVRLDTAEIAALTGGEVVGDVVVVEFDAGEPVVPGGFGHGRTIAAPFRARTGRQGSGGNST